MELTPDEIKLIRKALELLLTAHLVVETYEGEKYEDTKIDKLLRKFREKEQRTDLG